MKKVILINFSLAFVVGCGSEFDPGLLSRTSANSTLLATVGDCPTRIWPSQADSPVCLDYSGLAYATTGPNSSNWLFFDSCGVWRNFDVTPGEMVKIVAYGDNCAGCVIWHVNYVVQENLGSGFTDILARNPEPDFPGMLDVLYYTPTTATLRLLAYNSYYFAVYGGCSGGSPPVPPPVSVELKVEPETLNLKSRGRWVEADIEFPDGYDAGLVDLSTVKLFVVRDDGTKIGGLPIDFQGPVDREAKELNVKFSRADLQNLLSPSPSVTLMVTGLFTTGQAFEGHDTIRVID